MYYEKEYSMPVNRSICSERIRNLMFWNNNGTSVLLPQIKVGQESLCNLSRGFPGLVL